MAEDHSEQAPNPWRGLRAAWPDFLIAGFFVLVWIAPGVLGMIHGSLPGEEIVGTLVFLMFIEFLFVAVYGIVAGIAYSDNPAKPKLIGLGIIGLLLAPFLFLCCRAVKGIWPAYEFVLLGYNKWIAGKPGPGRNLAGYYIAFRWAAMGGLYIAAIFIGFFLPVPEFGVESWMARAADIPMSGQMVNEPHRMLAAGTIYFACLGIFEMIFDKITRKLRLPSSPA